LDAIASNSDISGVDDDSDIDQTYIQPGEVEDSSDEEEEQPEEQPEEQEEAQEEDMVVVPVVFDNDADDEDEQGPQEDGDGALPKRRRVSRRVIRREFEEGDLTHQLSVSDLIEFFCSLLYVPGAVFLCQNQ